jgi:Tfp pilus assembly protein PilF/TolB-like protein
VRNSGLIGCFLALLLALGASLSAAAQQPIPIRTTQILLVFPFANVSSAPGIDWIGESFPEIIGNRVASTPLFVISRDDRLYAFDRLGIPASAKPSRATVYEIAQQIDADYVILGRYNFDGSTFTAYAQVMDVQKLRISPELREAGPLTDLIRIQTALTWDILNNLHMVDMLSRNEFQAQFPPIRLDALENYIRGVIAANVQDRIKHFKETIRLEPKHTLAMLQLGKTYYNEREYEQAVNWLSRIPLDDRNANEAQFYLGMAAFYSSQLDKSEEAFRLLSTRLPLTEVYNNLGVVAARRGEKHARLYFEKAIQTDPNDSDYHFNLAVELLREGDSAGAIREAKESQALHADVDGKSLLDSLTAGTASKDHVPAERIKRNYDESSFRQLAMEIDNNNEAKLRKSDPVTHAAFHVQRGQQMLDEGLVSEAEKEFREAVILDPTNADAHAGLARVLESSQDNKGARNEARVSIRLKPSADAYLVLARLDLAENNATAAQQDVDHALVIDPANAAATSLKQDIATALAGKSAVQR